MPSKITSTSISVELEKVMDRLRPRLFAQTVQDEEHVAQLQLAAVQAQAGQWRSELDELRRQHHEQARAEL
jgi:hypothetical protein